MALLIIIGLVFLNFPNISKEVKNFFYSISAPAQERFNLIINQIKGGWKFLNALQEISQKNISLEKEIKELLAQNTKLKELEKENEVLRSRLNLPKDQNYQIELANVVGRDFQGLEKHMLINKGSANDVKKNMPIVAFNNILVGKVIEVYENFSKVLLIASSNSKVPALIQESRSEGIIYGAKENLFLLDLVPKDAKIEIGQTVITSGIEGIFPKGLLIGRVSATESLDQEMFLKIEVAPAVEFNSLERVFVIKNTQ